MYITAAPVDEHIRDLVLVWLESPEMVARLRQREAPQPNLHARIRADEDALEELAADHGNGEISRVEWKAARQQLATSTPTNALDAFLGTYREMRARWEASNLSQRRAIVTAVVDRVIVNPATKGNRFDKNRLDPQCRA